MTTATSQTAAQILATDPDLTQTDLEDYASFLAPEQQSAFWEQVASARS